MRPCALPEFVSTLLEETCLCHRALAIAEKFAVPVAGWQVHSTAWRLYQHANESGKPEIHRACCEQSIPKIANSFANEKPLRATFLSAKPVAEILGAGTAQGVQNSVANIASARPYRRLHWLRAASPAARPSLFAAVLMLDSFDVMIYSMVPMSILPDFGISNTVGGPASVRATAKWSAF